MGKVVVMEHLTLDGVYQAPGRPDEDRRNGFEYGGWSVAAANDPKMQEAMARHMGGVWALLVGRVTYEELADYWPKQQNNPMAETLRGIEKYVASTTLMEPLPWQNSKLLQGDAPEAITRLKNEYDKTFVIFGSGVLVRSLMWRNLIDEYVFMVHPIVLGKGLKLFPEGGLTARLKLTGLESTNVGVVISTYAPAAN